MRRLTCVFCGKQYIVSKFCKCDQYDYECPVCQAKNKKSLRPKSRKLKTLGNV